MFYTPVITGDNAEVRNDKRDEVLRSTLRDLEATLKHMVDEVHELHEQVGSDTLDWGDNASLPLSTVLGRGDFVGRRLADDVLRFERDVHEDAMRALSLANRYEATKDES